MANNKNLIFTGMLAVVILTMAGFLFNMREQVNADIPFVKNLDYNKFQGTWYEIAHIPSRFDINCKCGETIETLSSPLTFDVHEKCVRDGIPISHNATLVGEAPGLGNFTSYHSGIPSDYWIIDIDEQYRWAVIGQPSLKGFWLLSRTRTLNTQIIEEQLTKWSSYGYDFTTLKYIDQSNC